jgi:hypothetical protein
MEVRYEQTSEIKPETIPFETDTQPKRETTKEYRKKYYETHKDKWTGHRICDICHGKYILANKARHVRTLKHTRAIGNRKHILETVMESVIKKNPELIEAIKQHNLIRGTSGEPDRAPLWDR